MAHILIIGGGGMVGQKLSHSLQKSPLFSAADSVHLFDLAFPDHTPAEQNQVAGNVTDLDLMKEQIALQPDVIYHLASIVSGESESNFELGWKVNANAFRSFLDIVRAEHLASDGAWKPKVIFTSSIAVFGAPYPDIIGDEFLSAPQTSYGAQKAISELLITDWTRKGFIDGLSIRLPTICVRPGKANLAASSFFSGIIREPLNGLQADLPVSSDVRHWHASPRSAAGFLRHAGKLDLGEVGPRRALNLPGVSCTVEEQIEALRDLAGNDTVALIKPKPDETIMKIVAGWPRNFAPQRAIALGFQAEQSFHQIIQTYIDDDLPKAAI